MCFFDIYGLVELVCGFWSGCIVLGCVCGFFSCCWGVWVVFVGFFWFGLGAFGVYTPPGVLGGCVFLIFGWAGAVCFNLY